MAYYLCIGIDTLDEACRYATKKDALDTFRDLAEGLARFGQDVQGTIHVADRRSEIVEYPDWVLSLGPRGGLRCERC
jgi:hypothetical protein